ncbi:MAG TPA: hypothetical protein VNM92_07660, partial [Thermoanaerobaculia bacterium]|nr:hypothetical protein [Thermoanaerobaculia bacterium]
LELGQETIVKCLYAETVEFRPFRSRRTHSMPPPDSERLPYGTMGGANPSPRRGEGGRVSDRRGAARDTMTSPFPTDWRDFHAPLPASLRSLPSPRGGEGYAPSGLNNVSDQNGPE